MGDNNAMVVDVAAEIASAQERGAARVAELNWLLKRQSDVHANEQKKRFVAILHGYGVPDWAYPYVIRDDYDDSDFSVELPGLAPIGRTADGFHVLKPVSIMYYEAWYVHFERAQLMEDKSWDEAVFLANQFAGAYINMKDDAAKRNANGDKPDKPAADQPTAAARKRLAKVLNVDPADHVLAVADEFPGDGIEAGALWAALMIGAELRGIRAAVEDIAAVLLQPMDDLADDENNRKRGA